MLEGLNFLKVHTANTQLYVSVSQRRINSNLKLEESGSQRLFKHHSLIMSLCLLDALVHFTTVKHTHTHTHRYTQCQAWHINKATPCWAKLCRRPSGLHYQPTLKQHRHNKATVDIRLCPQSGAALWWVSLSICCSVKSVLPPVSHFEYTLFSVTYSWPLFATMTSSIKLEVHNILQCRQRKTAAGVPDKTRQQTTTTTI